MRLGGDPIKVPVPPIFAAYGTESMIALAINVKDSSSSSWLLVLLAVAVGVEVGALFASTSIWSMLFETGFGSEL